MARPPKEGLDYFPFDCNLDDKVELLEAEHGLIGFAILIKLWQRIYSQGYFIEWTEEQSMLFARRINTDLKLVNDVVDTCLRRKLFDKGLYDQHHILTSAGIQRRFLFVIGNTRRKNLGISFSYNLVSSDETLVITDETLVMNEETPLFCVHNATKESKGKEKKLNEMKVNKICTENEKLLLDYLQTIYDYPYSYEKDLLFIRELKNDFPDVNLIEQVKKWKVYKLDKPLKAKSNPRSQFRNWVANTDKYKRGEPIGKTLSDFEQPESIDKYL